MSNQTISTNNATPAAAPKRAGLILVSLIFGAFVCNLNLGVANVALPDIGGALNASQTSLTLVAVGCTLGLAMSVLYFGALGDRYGRKLLLLLGLGFTLPAAFICAWATSVDMLIAGRLLTGVAAGMAYPTTLALITALWAQGPQRTKAIALWSSISGGSTVLGPVLAGLLLEYFWWGSVFLIVVPFAVLGLIFIFLFVPAHVNESKENVDHIGGILSVIMIASLVLGIGIISAPNRLTAALSLLILAVVIAILFIIRQKRAKNPLYDLNYARRRFFWVPAVAGMIVFGSMMGAMFIGQQFLQNVLGYSTFQSGAAILPTALGMVAVASLSAKLVVTRGSRDTMLLGYIMILVAFLLMLIMWREETSYLWVGMSYLLIGVGAGLALTPASRSLTGSVPISRVGMGSGTSDLQRDLGGSIMQALFGTLLTLGYAASLTSSISASKDASKVTSETQAALTQSYSSAAKLAVNYPDYTTQIIAAAKSSFLSGANWAFFAGAVAVVLGGVLVATCLPGKDKETALMDGYEKADASVSD